MENLRRMLMAQDGGGASSPSKPASTSVIDLTGEPSTPKKSHKYKADPTPKTKFYVPPTSNMPDPYDYPGNPSSMPFRGTQVDYHGHPPPAHSTPFPSTASAFASKPEHDAWDDQQGVKDAPDFVFAATQTPEEREKALTKMIEQAVHLDDDYKPEDAIVDGLGVKLMPHQIQGYRWMRQREAGECKGGILADDMGLGKTVQALALIVGNSPAKEDSTIRYVTQEPKKGNNKKKKPVDLTEKAPSNDVDVEPEKTRLELKSNTTLIVAPLAVVAQWEREANEKTTGDLKVLIHHGPTRTKSAAELKRFDIVITTFPTASSEYSAIEKNKGDRSASPLFRARWLRVILDEAHNIKNHKTLAAAACFELSDRAHSRWCLTGTPIQNGPVEVFSLIHFLAAEPFNDWPTFKEKIDDPIKSNNQNRVNWGMKRLCVVLQTLMLRRAKDATIQGKPLLQLPDRTVQTVEKAFDNEREATFYREWQDEARKNASKEKSLIGQLVILLRLRQATSHPALVTKDIDQDASSDMTSEAGKKTHQDSQTTSSGAGDDSDADIDALASLLSGASIAVQKCKRCQGILEKDEIKAEELKGMCRRCDKAMAEEAAQGINWAELGSTKTRMMMDILQKIHKTTEEKTIVFSQFTSYLDLAQRAISDAGIEYVRYDGSMRPKHREESLRRIREDSSVRVILISFKAGSTGLNLTCCSRVILMDLWWNPALEAQAFDRAHRVGQTRNVEIYKIVISDTVEARILELQEKKLAIAKAALEGSKLKKGANKLSKKELWYLFHGSDQGQEDHLLPTQNARPLPVAGSHRDVVL
ncbi:unnamed protein product [Sympodiomycopsis kandeliae]